MRIKIFEKLGSCKHNDSKFRRIVGIKRGCFIGSLFIYIDNVLLQSKHYRHRIFNAYRFTALHTRFPFRHGTNHTKCFFIQIRVNTSYDFGIYNTTVLVNNELYCYTTLGTISLESNRIFDVLAQELHQTSHTTIREFRHLFYNLKNGLFFRFFFYNSYRHIFYFYCLTCFF